MPTQPLLRPPSLVDEIVAVIDEQLELPVDGFVGPRAAQIGLSQRRPRDRERVDRVRLAARPAARVAQAPSASAAPAPAPHRSRAAAAPASASVAGNPRPPTAARRRSRSPGEHFVATHRDLFSSSLPTGLVDRDSGHRLLVDVHSDHDHQHPPPIAVGGDRRADRPQSRRKPRSYQVTLDGLGRRRRHNAGQSASGDIRESSQPPPPESAPATGRRPAPRMTLSSGMTPVVLWCRTGLVSVVGWEACG